MSTFDQLAEILREEFLDDLDPAFPRHSWEMIDRLLKRAEVVACQSGPCELIYDSAITITIVAGTSIYPLATEAHDASGNDVGNAIIKLPRVIWSSEDGDIELEKTTVEALSEFEDTWRQADDDSPSRFFIKGRSLYLDKAPTDDDVTQDSTLNLHCYREPIDEDRTSPEIDAKHHYSLCYWAAYRLLMRPHEDTMRKELAEENLALFEREFGKRVDIPTLEYMLESAGYLQVSTGDDYSDIYRSSGSDWLRELG